MDPGLSLSNSLFCLCWWTGKDASDGAKETMFRIISTENGDGQSEGLLLFRLSGDYEENAAYLDDVFVIDPMGGDPVAGPATEPALLLALVAT